MWVMALKLSFFVSLLLLFKFLYLVYFKKSKKENEAKTILIFLTVKTIFDIWFYNWINKFFQMEKQNLKIIGLIISGVVCVLSWVAVIINS